MLRYVTSPSFQSVTPQVTVKRTHELMSSDDPQLSEGVIDKALESARKTVLDGARHAHVTNAPKRFCRASALKGLMDGIDGGIGEESTDAGSVANGGGGVLATVAAIQHTPTSKLHVFAAAAEASSHATLPAPMDISQQRQTGGDDDGEFGAGSLLQSLQCIKPCIPAPKGEAKPKSKTKATKSRTKGETTKPQTPAPAEAAQSLVESMKPSTTPAKPSTQTTTEKKISSSAADAVAEADKSWVANFEPTCKACLRLCPESEEEYKTALHDVKKEIDTNLKVVRARKRSVKRRTGDTAESAIEDANDFEQKLTLMSELVKLLSKPMSSDCGNAGDECYSKVIPLCDAGAEFSDIVYKMIAKLMWNDDLKWKRWSSMTDTTYKFLKRCCPDMDKHDLDLFFVQNSNVCLQKLIKGVPLEQVPCPCLSFVESC